MRSHTAAYGILKTDLERVFEFIEPTTSNLSTYSHRTFELLLRACTEVEALCKLVFLKNDATLKRNDGMRRFSDLDSVMKLSRIEVQCTRLTNLSLQPFASFAAKEPNRRSPEWYRAYNAVKHSRSSAFESASLKNVVDAVGAVYALLIAQIGPSFDGSMTVREGELVHRVGITLFHADLSTSPFWNEDQRYDYDWVTLKHQAEPFEKAKLQIRD